MNRIFSCAALFLAFLTLRAAAADYGTNILVNGDAETGSASSNGAAIAIPGWTTSGGVTVVKYGASFSNFPTDSDPGPPDRGNQFFAGGTGASSTATQTIDISANASDINAGIVTCDLSGYLGGSLSDDDYATAQLSFYNGATKISDGPMIGPVKAADRSNKTGLIYRLAAGTTVPPSTTAIKVTLVLTRVNGSFNDAYADNLSVVLRAPAVVTNTDDSGAGSLHQALTAGNTITFDLTAFAPSGGPYTIQVLTPLPDLVGRMTVQGPGSSVVTLQLNSSASFSAFLVHDTGNTAGVSISGFTVANAAAGQVIIYGGGIQNSGTLTVASCVFQNSNGVFGGAIYNSGKATVSNCSFLNNRVTTSGGAIYNSGNLIINSSTLTGNNAPTGAAIYNFQATATLIGCLVAGNIPGSNGATIHSAASSTAEANLTLNNCTVSGNSDSSVGAFVAQSIGTNASNFKASHLTLDSCTIVANVAIFDTAVLAGTSNVMLANSIFKGNTGSASLSPYTAGSILSLGYNMIDGSGGGIFNKTGDRTGTDAMLGPLQDNGGPTLTRALLPGSPAIDAGNSALTTDQRGAPRPFDDPASANGSGNASDIGAFEYGSTVPAPNPISVANISTRVGVQTGDNVAIGGFIISGTQPKKVIIRGIGPSLPISGALADPTLDLRDSSGTVLASNDNWMDASNKQAIIDSGVAPTSNLESAILTTLPANNSTYTAVLQGSHATTGVGLVEVYDLDSSVDSRLANISTRGVVGTGVNVLIGGFIVVGNPQKVIVRAIGPSLPVSGALADPYLELRDGNGVLIAGNDNWRSDQQAEIIATGIPPTNDLESAIIRTLAPGNYTAVVRGATDGTGVGLVEIYSLP